MIKLYGYWRSSAAYRVRIALHLKNIPHEHCPVHLLKDGGEQHHAAYRELNPQQLVPLLIDGDFKLNQSMAILEYLEEIYPHPALLPEDPQMKARVRAICLTMVADIHPLNNLRVLQYLENALGHDSDERICWYRHWITEGFSALEAQLSPYAQQGPYCFGAIITLADLCLIPQIYNAMRYGVSMEEYPGLNKIYEHCISLEAFLKASPEQQVDAL